MKITHKFRPRIGEAMKVVAKAIAVYYATLFLALSLIFARAASAQDSSATSAPPQHPHTHSGTQSIEVEFPRLGRAQTNVKEALFTLARALQTARENNPTLRQAEAGMKAARDRAQQAGLYPNPTIGYAGDEI